jgi:hypothetical protein
MHDACKCIKIGVLHGEFPEYGDGRREGFTPTTPAAGTTDILRPQLSACEESLEIRVVGIKLLNECFKLSKGKMLTTIQPPTGDPKKPTTLIAVDKKVAGKCVHDKNVFDGLRSNKVKLNGGEAEIT